MNLKQESDIMKVPNFKNKGENPGEGGQSGGEREGERQQGREKSFQG